MSERRPVERVEVTSAGSSLGPVGAGAVLVLAGLVTLFVAGEMTTWNASDPGTAMQVAGAVLIVTTAVGLVLKMVRNRGRVVEFREDALAMVAVDRHGRESDVGHVGYDEVDLAVRAGMDDDEGETTVTYLLVCSDEPPAVLDSVDDPQTVERVLRERVPDPDERTRVVEADGRRSRSVDSERQFWADWPAEHPLPSSPVVDRSALPDALSDLVPDAEPTEEWIPRPTIADQMKTSGKDHWDTGATVPWEWE